MHYMYVLRSASDGRFYIDYSANLRKRIKEHVQGSSFATSYRGPWQLIYYEAYLEQADALGREKYPKSGAGCRFLKSQVKHYLRNHPSQGAAWRSFYAGDAFARERIRHSNLAGIARPQRREHHHDLHACAQSAGNRGQESARLRTETKTPTAQRPTPNTE